MFYNFQVIFLNIIYIEVVDYEHDMFSMKKYLEIPKSRNKKITSGIPPRKKKK